MREVFHLFLEKSAIDLDDIMNLTNSNENDVEVVEAYVARGDSLETQRLEFHLISSNPT